MMMIRRSIAMLAIVGLAWGCDDGDDCPEPIVGEDAGGIDASVPEPDGGHPAECVPGPRGDEWYGGYEDSLLEQQARRFIAPSP